MVMDVKEDVKCVILPCSKYLFLLSKHSGIRAIEKKAVHSVFFCKNYGIVIDAICKFRKYCPKNIAFPTLTC